MRDPWFSFDLAVMDKIKVSRGLGKWLIWIVTGWLLVWGLANVAAPKVLATILPKVQEKAKSMGVEIDRIQYSKIRVSPWLTSVTAHQVSIDFDLVPGDRNRLSSTYRSETIQVSLRNLFKLRGSVEMGEFELKFHPSDLPSGFPFDGFTDGYVMLRDVPLLDPREGFREMINGVVDLFDDNVTSRQFDFSGKVQIKSGEEIIPARLYSERHGEKFRLRFSHDDVRSAAEVMQLRLADDQVEIVFLYPLRIPVISAITERARMISLMYYQGDHWKQDALRHVTWSFLLTSNFDPDFAKLVTDAQEAKPGNTHYERLMDYNNNAVGRKWVTEKVQLQDIPRMLLTDSRVVLSPDDAQARSEGELLK